MISSEEYATRFDRMQRMMKAKGIRAQLIYSPHRDYRPAYMRWLTGWWTKEEESGILVITDSSDPVLFMNGTSYRTGDIFRAKDSSYVKDINPTIDYALDISTYLKKVGVTRGQLGIAEWRVFPAKIYIEMHKLMPDVEWVDTSGAVNELCLIKSPAEIELMKKAAQITDSATQVALGALKPGVTEHELMSIAEFEAKKLGAEISFISELGSGVHRTWIGEPVPSDKKLEAGELVIMDWGARWEGYHSDISRTYVVGGEPSAQQRKLLSIVYDTLEAGIAAIRPGVMASAPTSACQEVVKDAGYANYWNPAFIPHGIGIALHEEPMLEPGYDDRMLEAGMFINLEPGLYIDDIGGVRLENTVLVTSTGGEVINALTTQWW